MSISKDIANSDGLTPASEDAKPMDNRRATSNDTCKSISIDYSEIIISDDLYVYEAIQDNDPASGNTILMQNDWVNFLEEADKIDLLIVCKSLDPKLVPVYKIRTIINLSANNITGQEIHLSKPHKLSQIIEAIAKSRQGRNSLFYPLNDTWIYNEKYSCITSETDTIKFTEKENALFRALLLSRDHKIDKEQLLISVWNYHQNSESTTVDTHLYKLRQKLPDGMVSIKDNICSLVL